MGLLGWLKSKFVDPRMEADEKVPLRRWSRAAIAIITGGDDYGYFPADKVRDVLVQMWDVRDTANAEKTVRDLAGGDGAWDLLRGIHVARMSAGAELVTPERSWELVAPIARKIQTAFKSWDELATEYRQAQVKWAQSTGADIPDDEDFASDLDVTRDVYWKHVSFQQDLSAASF